MEDDDWRVRVLAQVALNEYAGCPLYDRVDLLDELRMKVSELHDW